MERCLFGMTRAHGCAVDSDHQRLERTIARRLSGRCRFPSPLNRNCDLTGK